MSLVTWNTNYSVNVKQFDDQHMKLVDLVNKLHDAMKVGKGSEVIGDVLKSLVAYTQNHFADEERLMKQHGYPDYENHKKEHNQLVMQVQDVNRKVQQGSPALTQSVMLFLRDWLVKHIQGEDKKYGPFLNGKGVK